MGRAAVLKHRRMVAVEAPAGFRAAHPEHAVADEINDRCSALSHPLGTASGGNLINLTGQAGAASVGVGPGGGTYYPGAGGVTFYSVGANGTPALPDTPSSYSARS